MISLQALSRQCFNAVTFRLFSLNNFLRRLVSFLNISVLLGLLEEITVYAHSFRMDKTCIIILITNHRRLSTTNVTNQANTQTAS